jgi:DNA polymerase V
MPDRKKQICTSRSFGEPIKNYGNLLESVAMLASQCVFKLRQQKCCCKTVYLFIQTSRFLNDIYMPSKTINLSFYTSDTSEILGYCREALNSIYSKDYEYKRAGVILLDILPEDFVMVDLFDPIDREKRKRLTNTIDKIAKKNGRDAVKLAVQGMGYRQNIRQLHLSRRYTTSLKEIIDVKV